MKKTYIIPVTYLIDTETESPMLTGSSLESGGSTDQNLSRQIDSWETSEGNSFWDDEDLF